MGESMEALISDGSLCMVDRKERRVKNGRIYAVNTLEGLFVKQCVVEGERIILQSLNPAYAPMEYAMQNVNIVGRIKAVIRRV
ncbi:hypothetical protein CQA49_01350 [Helicobacter sp. MIT 00-7814]|uniref:S24 family peptidase n=1 Tax=unclassified Helicobacter TaxID=2593540 RepID=UPI000E1E88FF|nr:MULTISPECIES: S24 family peptidase [unclassified Helicobacter]RDU53281.1 hypothetical protein CQA37_07135 [Helicobacter sp. MIT 99-10781]RDU56966.1 hypothetical protein CQA49_01350 [Helicobacter sp. MIT 00-7814]